MHLAALQLVPVLGAEKSKTPFYIAGGLLVAWALIVSLAIGVRRPAFPRELLGERAVIAISVVLVLAAVTTAVVTSSPPAKAGAQTPPAEPIRAGPFPGTASASAPTPATTTATTAPRAPSSSRPAARSGTPASSHGAKRAPSAAAPTHALKLAANPSGLLAYDTKQLSAKRGPVTISFTNAAPLEHNVTIAQGSKVFGATPTFAGGSRSLSLTLTPGTYTFYCSVPGHRAAGMEGTLTIS